MTDTQNDAGAEKATAFEPTLLAQVLAERFGTTDSTRRVSIASALSTLASMFMKDEAMPLPDRIDLIAYDATIEQLEKIAAVNSTVVEYVGRARRQPPANSHRWVDLRLASGAETGVEVRLVVHGMVDE